MFNPLRLFLRNNLQIFLGQVKGVQKRLATRTLHTNISQIITFNKLRIKKSNSVPELRKITFRELCSKCIRVGVCPLMIGGGGILSLVFCQSVRNPPFWRDFLCGHAGEKRLLTPPQPKKMDLSVSTSSLYNDSSSSKQIERKQNRSRLAGLKSGWWVGPPFSLGHAVRAHHGGAKKDMVLKSLPCYVIGAGDGSGKNSCL